MNIYAASGKIRGCYSEVPSTNNAAGAYLTVGGSVYGGPPSTLPGFISGVTIAQKERYSILPCFMDKNFLYAFGHNAAGSTLEVQFTLFLVGDDGRTVGGSLDTMLKAYASSRISKNPKPAVFTLGKASATGYVVGMTSGTSDPHLNIQTFSFLMVTTAVQGLKV